MGLGFKPIAALHVSILDAINIEPGRMAISFGDTEIGFNLRQAESDSALAQGSQGSRGGHDPFIDTPQVERMQLWIYDGAEMVLGHAGR